MTKKKVFLQLKKNSLLLQKQKEKPVRIAINGIEGTGKAVFTKS